MFNAIIGNIFSTAPRQAEHTDTRQGIQRHDPDYERPRKDKNPKEEDDFTQDGAIVSVSALLVFLENFIKNGADENVQRSTKSDNLNPTVQSTALDFKIQTELDLGKNENKTKSGAAAYAASSYQNAAHTNEKSAVLLETTDTAGGPSLDLSAADIRTIHALIEDLKTLNAANIEYLKIERAASFLESLINAVNKIKTTI